MKSEKLNNLYNVLYSLLGEENVSTQDEGTEDELIEVSF